MTNINTNKQFFWSIPLEERVNHIIKHPAFCLLDYSGILELTYLMEEIYINTNEVIVQQGDYYDGFFLIVSGRAVVTRSLNRIQKTNPKHIVTLGPNNAIGIGKVGFHNLHAVRSSTVTAISPMILLKIRLTSFYFFLQKYGEAYPYLKNMSERFLILYFIKNTQLFNNLSPNKIREIEKKDPISLNETEISFDKMILRWMNNKKIDDESFINNLTTDEILLIIMKLKALGVSDLDLIGAKNASSFLKKIIIKIMTFWKRNSSGEISKK